MAKAVYGDQKLNITTNTTTAVKAAGGTLVRICVNTPAAGTIKCYDDPATTNNLFATITLTAAMTPYSHTFECDFKNGLTIVTSVAMDLTVVYF